MDVTKVIKHNNTQVKDIRCQGKYLVLVLT